MKRDIFEIGRFVYDVYLSIGFLLSQMEYVGLRESSGSSATPTHVTNSPGVTNFILGVSRYWYAACIELKLVYALFIQV